MLAALSTASLARRSARRPWTTIAVWLVALVLSLAAAAMWLGDALTTANGFTNKPEALVADDLLTERFFPPGPRDVTEVLYIHSDNLTVDDEAFRAFVARASETIGALGSEIIRDGPTLSETGAGQIVSLDRHSTGIVFTLVDDYPDRMNRAAYLDIVTVLNEEPGFAAYPVRAPGSSRPEMVIVESSVYAADTPQFRQFVEDLLLRIISLGRDAIGGAATYYATGDASLIAADGTATAIPVILNGWDNLGAVLEIVEDARTAPDFDVWITGAATVDHDFTELSERDLTQGELRIGLPAAIVVLILVFGAVIAAAVPLVMALVSIGIAMGLAAIVGTSTDLSIFVVNMIFMMGLAVGIDYGLFVIARFREERANGLDVQAAIAKAGATSSRAVFFSGVTVVLALVGMLLVPTTIFFSLGLGAILVVVVSIAASLTLLPAVLSLLGDRINRLRVPFITRRGYQRRDTSLWSRIAHAVMRAPVVSLVLSAGLLILLALPTLGLQTGAAGVSSFPQSFESRSGFEVLQAKFSTGVVNPTHVIIDGDPADPAVRGAIDALKARIDADPEFGPIAEETVANAAWLRMPIIAGDPVSAEAIAAVGRLRNEYIPEAFAGVPAEALVTGDTAGNMDWFEVADAAAIVVFPFVLVLSFLLLMLVFRSIVIPLNAIAMNLLSVGAAYGVLVLVFQRGIGNELFGFQQVDTVEAWIPVFLFSVLFGLSMDYHVFLLSRIKERYAQTHDNVGSIAFGLHSTGRLITGAALIMVAVFGGFASGDLVMFEQMGFGLAVAVLIDATIVRSVLVPATMRLLGRWNWYLPGFLNWLPDLNVEGADTHAAKPAPAE